jgi:hypothetical protein
MAWRCFFGWLAPMLCLLALTGAARADEYVFVDTAVVTDKFETSLRVLKERLDSESPPKWMLYKAEVTFSKASGIDGEADAKIPVLIAEAEVSGEYQQLSTTTETVVYTPRATVPVNFDDSGLLEFLTRIHQEAREEMQAESDFLPTRATFEDEFFVRMDAGGKLSFFSIFSVGGGGELKNSHQFRFHFCLVGNDGACVPG